MGDWKSIEHACEGREMTDLFGEQITAPQCAAASDRAHNLSAGFAEFWAAWPKGPRKVAKQQALNKWARYSCHRDAAFIVAHVEWMKSQDDWLRENGRFICAPQVYLNQRRWLEWELPPERGPQPDKLDELKENVRRATPAPKAVRSFIDRVLGRHQ